MFTLSILRRGCAVLALTLLLTQAANAGLPLVCNPFQTGDAKLLPWSDPPGRFNIDPQYQVKHLARDMLELLAADSKTFARMENMRRAAVYATTDRDAANELLKALLLRMKAAARDSREAALAWFDAAYLIESYRQQGMTHKTDMLAAFDKANPGLRSSLGALDSYVLVQKAIEITHEPEMEYAASLMTFDKQESARHRAAALAGAGQGSLLAVNLKNW